jgi:hypothetical protein
MEDGIKDDMQGAEGCSYFVHTVNSGINQEQIFSPRTVSHYLGPTTSDLGGIILPDPLIMMAKSESLSQLSGRAIGLNPRRGKTFAPSRTASASMSPDFAGVAPGGPASLCAIAACQRFSARDDQSFRTDSV